MRPSRIIVALDNLNISEVNALCTELYGLVAGFKANDALDVHGARFIETLTKGVSLLPHSRPPLTMADPKLHDIPTTMTNRTVVYNVTGWSMVTIHASNSVEAMRAAATAAGNTMALGVTVLTSIDDDECIEIFGATSAEKVEQFAQRGWEAGLRGFVCSPREVASLRTLLPNARLVVPGVRSAGTDTHEQMRVDTPENAVRNGADYVVCGREITRAKDPAAQARKINQAIAQALD